MKKEKVIDEKQPKKKRKIFKKLLLVLLIFVGIVSIFLIGKNIYYKINDSKIIKAMDNLEQERVSLIFIEINPSFVLTMKNNKVEDIACLNDDCLSFYDDIDVTGKNTNDSIDYLYKLSKDKGFDTSKGVNIKTTTEIEVNLDYVKVDYIDENVKNEMLSNVLNNDDIKENNQNENYYSKLWEELKKDADYGNVYTCKMNNKELECHFIVSSITPNNGMDNNKIIKTFDVLDKFSIDTKRDRNDVWGIYIDNVLYEYMEDTLVGGETLIIQDTSPECINKTYDEATDSYIHTNICPQTTTTAKEPLNLKMALVKVNSSMSNNTVEYLYIKDLNLLNPVSSLSNINKY